MRTRQLPSLALSGALGLLGVAGPSAPPAYAHDAAVTVADSSFTPGTVTIEAGNSVTWTRAADAVRPHSLTSDEGDWAANVTTPVARTFTSTGTFDYWCKYHGAKGSGMHGRVVVRAEEAPSAAPSRTAPAAPSRSPSRRTPAPAASPTRPRPAATSASPTPAAPASSPASPASGAASPSASALPPAATASAPAPSSPAADATPLATVPRAGSGGRRAVALAALGLLALAAAGARVASTRRRA